MRLLLDTHVVLWLIDDPQRLPDRWPDAIAAADQVRLSAVVGWEIAVKRSLGRLQAPEPADIERTLTGAGFEPLHVNWEHAVASAELPWLHRDPFDRLLVAQAQVEQLLLVTVDEQLRAYDVAALTI
jgi:PIN domain nuclease of toxin-antitoxin system